jgi:hypothetical protein
MRRRLLVFSLFIMTFAAGCPSDSKKETGNIPLELQPTSITNLLTIFTGAYRGRNYDEYRNLFDGTFVYVFAPQDVGGPNNIPAEWSLTEDLLSTQHMFADAVNRDGYRTEEIHLIFTPGADTATDLNPNWRKVVLSNVNLEVAAREGTSNDPLTYQVAGDKANLYFVQTDETVPGTDLRIWKIVRWEDKPISLASAKVRRTTWGLIKASWR